MRLVLIGGAAAVMAATTASVALADPPGTADLRIVVDSSVGPVEFRTLYLPDPAFALDDGRARIFRHLDPGTYVVVQAPPVGAELTMRCSNGDSAGAVRVDGADVTCTFTVR